MTNVLLRRRAVDAAWQAWLPVTLVVAWFVFSAESTSPFFPPLSKIVAAAGSWFASGGMISDLTFSFTNYAVALLLSIVIGLGIGIPIGLLPAVARVLDPFFDVLRSLPVVVFVPIVIMVLGIGSAPKVLLIVAACTWPILLHAVEGVRSIPPSVFESARAYIIPLGLRVRKVVLPGALPQIAVGLRLAITIGLVMLVVSEMYGSTRGIGYFIVDSSGRFRMADAWAGTLLVGILGWAITAVYGLVEHRLLAWHRQSDAPRAAAGAAPTKRPGRSR